MKRIFEFRCKQKHTSENYIDEKVITISCPTCQCKASRVISAPRISLEGVTGDFPTASDAWANKHEQATRIAEKRREG